MLVLCVKIYLMFFDKWRVTVMRERDGAKMKKRTLFLVAVSLASLLFSGCGDNNIQESSAESKTSSSVVSEASKENSVKETDLLLMKSFGELWMSDNFYIDVIMTTRYDPSAIQLPSSAASGASSSESSGADDSGIVTVKYSYIIEADRVNEIAALNMISEKGNQCTIVKDNKIYSIDHNTKTYSYYPYDGTATEYAGKFTTNICLGAVNNCTFQSTGKTKYDGKNVTFERYKLDLKSYDEYTDQGIQGDTYVEYYFDSLGKPVAEVVQSNSGNITFDFVKISDSLEVKDMLEIPEGYKEVTE